jgi:spore germination cell wall hydrolase CwlJ-like protein
MKQIILLLALVPTVVDMGQKIMCLKPTAPKPIAKVDPKQIKCLATAIYGEARSEQMLGQVAVAYTALNRAVKKTLCQVVLQPYQYSVFNNNPRLRSVAISPHLTPKLKNDIDKQGWEMAMSVAHQVAHRIIPDPTNGSTFYQYKMVAKIDNHKFYKPQEKVLDRQLALL